MRFGLSKKPAVYIINRVHAALCDSLQVEKIWQPVHMSPVSTDSLRRSLTSDADSLIEQALERYIASLPRTSKQIIPLHEFLFHPANGISGNTFHHGAEYTTTVKGMPEAILRRCSLSEGEREAINLTIRKHAKQGGYILALAEVTTEQPIRSIQQMKHLDFLGLIICKMTIGPKQRQLLARYAKGNAPFYIMSGQHPSSGHYIAKELHIPLTPHTVLDCTQLPLLTDAQALDRVKDARIICRAQEEKGNSALKHIKALHDNIVFISTKEELFRRLG